MLVSGGFFMKRKHKKKKKNTKLIKKIIRLVILCVFILSELIGIMQIKSNTECSVLFDELSTVLDTLEEI